MHYEVLRVFSERGANGLRRYLKMLQRDLQDCVAELRARPSRGGGLFRLSVERYHLLRKRLCLEAVFMALAHTLSLLEFLVASKPQSLDDYEWLVMFKYKLEYSECAYQRMFPARSKRRPLLTFQRLQTDCSARPDEEDSRDSGASAASSDSLPSFEQPPVPLARLSVPRS